MPVNYTTKTSDVFLGNATLWYGTAVPFSSSNISGGQPTAGTFAGLTEKGDVIQCSFGFKLESIIFEGNQAPSKVAVVEKSLTIQATNCGIYGSAGSSLLNALSGGVLTTGSAFGGTSSTFTPTSFTVIGKDLLQPVGSSKLCVVSMYAHTCEEFSLPFSQDNLTKISFTLKGKLHSTEANGLGILFYV